MSDSQDSKVKMEGRRSPGAEPAEDSATRALSDALRSSFTIIKFVMAILVVVFLGSNLRIVESNERAIILRFGKPVGQGEEALLDPGAHWAFPYPIDEIVRIPVGEAQTVSSTVGWYATTAAEEAAGTERPAGPTLNPEQDGYLLTADENIVHARGVLRYRIDEPGLRYEFGLMEASNMVANAFDNALVQTAARFRVDGMLTGQKTEFQEEVRRRLEKLIALQNLGIVVDQIELQTRPPRQLQEKFDAALEAKVNSDNLIDEAKREATEMAGRAASRAAAIRSEGERDRQRTVAFLMAESNRFVELLPAYRRNPRLFLEQQRSEVFGRILTNAQEKILLPDRARAKPYELRILLNRAPERLPLPASGGAAEDSH